MHAKTVDALPSISSPEIKFFPVSSKEQDQAACNFTSPLKPTYLLPNASTHVRFTNSDIVTDISNSEQGRLLRRPSFVFAKKVPTAA